MEMIKKLFKNDSFVYFAKNWKKSNLPKVFLKNQLHPYTESNKYYIKESIKTLTHLRQKTEVKETEIALFYKKIS